MSDSSIYKQISKKGQIAVLIDPEKYTGEEQLRELIQKSEFAGVNYFFIGGSTVTRDEFERCISVLRSAASIPVVIFPGASHQISDKADALLYLSLISGRNPDFLIGHHVASAQEVYDMNIEILPTGYILVDGGNTSSVAYVSQTTPIPPAKTSIILNTAKAGILQGKQLLYLDAGSGAQQHVPTSVVKRIAELGKPIIIGGGIRSKNTIAELHEAGANVVVIGNKIEEDLDFLLDIHSYLKSER
jgi:geranylgeranylglyceryl phosphate synthase family protein